MLYVYLAASRYICGMSAIEGISVIIPNYNGEVLLPQVLPMVFAALQTAGIDSEIIVADDCSTDGSIALLKNEFPTIRIVQNNINCGFSVTANHGISAAKYNWVLLLNSDVKLEPGYFAPLLKYTSMPNVFGVMGRIIGWEDETIQDAAKYPAFQAAKIKTSGNYILQPESEMAAGLFTMYLSGANAFINKKIFSAIGGLNELFSPFYVEDFELGLRAWRLGYTCYYEHQAVCRHKTSTTIASGNKKENIRKVYNRNKMYLHAIHLSTGMRICWFIQLFFESMLQVLFLKTYYLKALGLFASTYKKAVESRQQLALIAKGKNLLSVGEVTRLIRASIKGKNIHRF